MIPLLEVRDLAKQFPGKRGRPGVRAVDGLSFSLTRGSTLGLVGESGCGKSTTGRLLLRLLEPSGGTVLFDGQNVLTAGRADMRRLRRQMQIVFQDPYSSLNPRMTVHDIIADPLVIHGLGDAAQRRSTVIETLEAVGLGEEHAGRYPHSFSGGQRQRIAIARALVLDPSFIVCDEPVSALDVSIQAQIVNLLKRLQSERTLTYLFISHDLSVVRHMADRVAVMHLGRIVEIADRHTLYGDPLHPYTRSLLSAIPVPDPLRQPDRVALAGDPPDPANPPSGCRFRLQCRYAQNLCVEHDPVLTEIRSGHAVACHFAGALPPPTPLPQPQRGPAHGTLNHVRTPHT
jgi:oligopeptide transport system ATP-binding protein